MSQQASKNSDSRGKMVMREGEQHSELIDGMKIPYRIYGSGPQTLLLLHGAVGSNRDFDLQMRAAGGLDANQFTVVAPDLPGYGKSEVYDEERAAACLPTLEYFEMCARVAAQLMVRLGAKTYSLGGWNDGARVAALLAVECQSRVNALILWGFSPTMDKRSCLATARARDTSIWEPSVLSTYAEVYGEQQFSDLWRRYVDFVVQTLELPDQFDIRARLCAIKCPTLVLHGSNDPIISYRDHVAPIGGQIYDSHVKQFPGLAHNIHQADPDEFNQVIARFIASEVVVASA